MAHSPRALILNLLLGAEARGGGDLPVRDLLLACELFGLSANTVRVALARGLAAGLLVSPQRGWYALGPEARPVADAVGRWRSTLDQLVPWQGQWLAVHVGANGRSDRTALRARERAMALLGLAEFERGLHLRPDNLMGGAQALRQRLSDLLPAGTQPGTVFALRDLSAADAARAGSLWDGAALDTACADGTTQLTAWLDQAGSLPPDRAAREAFELGHEAIRRLVFDPLLPAPLVDAATRERFVATVIRFDAAGQALWQRFLASDGSRSTPVPLPAEETLHERA